MEETDFRALPSILDLVNEFLHLRTARIITRRMEGASLRDISLEEGLTRTEARSTEKKGLEKLFSLNREVQEDEYRYLYEHYDLDDKFYKSLQNGSRVLYYLKNRYEVGFGTAERAVKDSQLSPKIINEISTYYHYDNSDYENSDHNKSDHDDSLYDNSGHEDNMPHESDASIRDNIPGAVSYSAEPERSSEAYTLDTLPQYIREAIDDLWNSFLACGITEDKKILEQAGIFLFLKYLDDAELKNIADSYATGTAAKSLYYDEAHQHLRWSYFHHMESTELLALMNEQIIPFIKNDLRVDTKITYTKFLADIRFSISDPTRLSGIISCIDSITDSVGLTLYTVFEALIAKTSYKSSLMQLTCDLLDAGFNDTICNLYPSVDFDLSSYAAYLRDTRLEELEKVWNKMHFKNDMFYSYCSDSSVLVLSSLQMLLLGIESPKAEVFDVLKDEPPAKFSRVIAKIPSKATANPKYVRPSVKAMVTSNLPMLMFMYACHEALEKNGICILNIPHRNLLESSASHQRLREFYVKDNTILSIINIASKSRDLLVYQNTPPSGAYNIRFINGDEPEDSFLVSSIEIETNDFNLGYENYSKHNDVSEESFDNPEPTDEILRRIYNTQDSIDGHIEKIKQLMENL